MLTHPLSNRRVHLQALLKLIVDRDELPGDVRKGAVDDRSLRQIAHQITGIAKLFAQRGLRDLLLQFRDLAHHDQMVARITTPGELTFQ